MVKPVVKAKTPTSAAGNKQAMQGQRGFTLLELLVVMAIIALSMLGIGLSLRDNHQTQLEREAQRLVALLEAARAQSRTSGVPLVWQTTAQGFVIGPVQNAASASALSAGNSTRTRTSNSSSPPGLAPRTQTWLSADTQAVVSRAANADTALPPNLVVLGPEPILSPTRITLSGAQTGTSSATSPSLSLTLGTDGLHPFQVLP